MSAPTIYASQRRENAMQFGLQKGKEAMDSLGTTEAVIADCFRATLLGANSVDDIITIPEVMERFVELLRSHHTWLHHSSESQEAILDEVIEVSTFLLAALRGGPEPAPAPQPGSEAKNEEEEQQQQQHQQKQQS